MKAADYLITTILDEAELSPEALLSMARMALESNHEGERAAAMAALKKRGHDPHDIIRRATGGAQPKAPKPAQPKPAKPTQQKRPKTSTGTTGSRPRTSGRSRGGFYGEGPYGEDHGKYPFETTWNLHGEEDTGFEDYGWKPKVNPETIRRNRSAFDARMKASEAKFGRK